MEVLKTCIGCKDTLSPEYFYKQKGHYLDVMSYCKSCFNKRCIQRWINRKLDAIHYKGDSCEKCNLHIAESHYSVFEFHHLDPNQKDYDWTKLRLRPIEDIEAELNKCQLLCANCHRLVHSLDFPEQVKSQ